MSDLQALCQALDEVTRPLPILANMLQQRAARLRSLAAEIHTAAWAVENGPDCSRIVQGLHEASTASEASAGALIGASQQGRSFIERTIGGGAGSSAAGRGGESASTDGIEGWLGGINPGYTGDPFDPRSNNCGNCALGVFNQLSRHGSGPVGTGTLTTPEMEAATGRKQVSMTPAEISQRLIDAGPGSHAVVGIDRQGAPGHWFNAYYDGNRVVAIDGQSGTVSGWPPDYGTQHHPVTNWDAGI